MYKEKRKKENTVRLERAEREDVPDWQPLPHHASPTPQYPAAEQHWEPPHLFTRKHEASVTDKCSGENVVRTMRAAARGTYLAPPLSGPQGPPGCASVGLGVLEWTGAWSTERNTRASMK
jgi:hypothetical protein